MTATGESGAPMLSYDMDSRGGLGLYEHLFRCIRDDILSGALDPNDRLPSKRRLAEHLGVSVITVEGAYRQLVAEGYAHSLPKRGFYVSELPQNARGAVRPRAAIAPTVPASVGSAAAAAQRPNPAGSSTSVGPSAPAALSVPACFADFTHPSLRSGSSAARLWGKALRSALSQEDERALFSSQPPQGSPRLRRAVAAYLRSARGMDVDPDCVVVGAGSQILYGMIPLLAAGVASDSSCAPGLDPASGSVPAPVPVRIALEDPGYPRLYETYRMLGASVVPVPLDAEGMDVAALGRTGATVAHVMPSHQFPTGRVTSVSRRYELLGWASRRPGRLIVEDDYDWEFRFAGRPIPALQSIDAEGRVIYLSTFSKSLSAALRIAFAVVPPRLIERLQAAAHSAAHSAARRPAAHPDAAQTDPSALFGLFAGTVSSVDQIALARLLESGDYERHLNRYRKESRDVRDALALALESAFPRGDVAIEEADSGLHFVLALRVGQACVGQAGDSPDAGEAELAIAREALKLGVRLAPLSSYAMGEGDRRVMSEPSGSAPASVPSSVPSPATDGRARFVMQYDGLEPGLVEKVAQAILQAAAMAGKAS